MHRLSRLLATTRREPPADAATAHDALLVRAGLLHREEAGTVLLAPLLVRTFRRVEAVAREELDRAGGQEIRLPLADPPDAPRAAFVGGQLLSYRQLPLVLYEVATRPRAEPAPRLGLLHLREGTAVTAWSYDLDAAAADDTAGRLAGACARVLERCGLACLPAEDMGTTALVTPCDAGDEVVAVSDAGAYRALEGVARAALAAPARPEAAPVARVDTPGATTIAALRAFVPDVPPERTVKTLLYGVLTADGAEVVAVLCRGDRSVHEGKLAHALAARELAMADAATVRATTGAEPGYAGPVGLPDDVRVVGDVALADVQGFVCGANAEGVHLRDVWWGRDVALPTLLDLDAPRPGDPAPDGGALELVRGVRVGHVTTGSADVTTTVAGPAGNQQAVHTGGAALRVEPLVAAVVERHHDDAGICWPAPVAPHGVAVVTVRPDDPTQARLAGQLLERLAEEGVDALWDDRDLRAGAKFADAELLGIPWRVTVGRDASEGLVEVADRRGGAVRHCTVEEAAAQLAASLGPPGVPPLP